MSDEKQQVSRRQFLNYTLTGVGGFMAAGLLISPVRMAIDPVLKSTEGGDMANVGLAVDDITEDPQRIDWTVDQVDGWYESEVNRSAWVYRNENDEIVAFSPVCKHLGCVVSWEGSESYPNEFFCPCHNGRYYKDGTNVPGTPPLQPLDVYEQEVRDGMLFLGEVKAYGEA
ncbi:MULTISPECIES: ubiquinol-cytochrome c reductase iron-sulfur subunit [Oceanobacillus]|uniref:Menaquinol-cytochrome c reductase iron-sulfur subunit n=1 Tax=Oceanobacillus kimchii TaxID=746691 RepID=A0ABQ5TKZ4_9BACI|nr:MULTISPECIES: ubiquinol-cytochrome c reductase iron-sulfur subunit [Oceanobacillus]MBT2598472.1 ubiquinol-cytochrome c reductase iron-sulfur subunit [Oceanobacillus sp. ISL-74]MBT2651390.1 ubiquinol-cytochrome c reductase iron-sulfur subunit [Oceanobacillus sp. ISL-73]OEH55782.1 menaquinol-cytochrome C reductase [Oceanobacillus sp. E9]GLO66431.1 menaquinol-cytochrome c reductase iron-sulfur subunit [Oceanobacillus kimchii]